MKGAKSKELKHNKYDYVLQNLCLFIEAFREYENELHVGNKHHRSSSPNYLNFVKRARKHFGYSKSTGNSDIWMAFQFSEVIIPLSIKRKNAERKALIFNKMNRISQSLDYIQNKI